MASLSLKNIHKVYPNGFHAVKHVDLEIADKEFLVFVGPLGCGKSTMLRMIAGLEDVTSGDIYMDGRKMNDLEPKDREIAMIFQNHALYPDLTVYDNMAFGLKLCKADQGDIDGQIRKVAHILEIESLLTCKPGELSEEQTQRVAMGRAMVRSPKVFLMDDPLSDLDDELRVQMRQKLANLYHKLEHTILYVTEDPMEAMSLGTRIVVMNDGMIQQVDTPENLTKHPINMFVADFLGTVPMRMTLATLSRQGEDVLVNFDEQSFAVSSDLAKAAEEKGYVGREVVLGVHPEEPADGDCDGFVTVCEEEQQVEWKFDKKKIHLFDPETQMAIGH